MSYNGLLKFIETELTRKLGDESALEAPLQGRLSRQVKHMPIQAEVNITEEAYNNNHKLEIVANDRPGLLATIAHKLLLQEVELHNAKINTLGNRAEDSFLISARKGQKLNATQVKTLQQALMETI